MTDTISGYLRHRTGVGMDSPLPAGWHELCHIADADPETWLVTAESAATALLATFVAEGWPSALPNPVLALLSGQTQRIVLPPAPFDVTRDEAPTTGP